MAKGSMGKYGYCAGCGEVIVKDQGTKVEGYFGPLIYCQKAKCQRVAQLPVPVKKDSRVCFGISYFATEAEADTYAAFVRERGDTYNGGYMHGVPCGRDRGHDYVDKATGQQLYAVTTA